MLDVIHTAKSLACEIGYWLQDMQDFLLYCGTTDNASNVTSALEKLLNNDWKEDGSQDDIVEYPETGFQCQDQVVR